MISLYAGGTFLVLALSLGVIFHQGIGTILEESLQDKAVSLARQLATVTLDAVMVYDYGALERYVADLATNTDAIYLQIRRADGEILASAGDKNSLSVDKQISVDEPIRLLNNHIGDITIAFDRSGIDSVVRRFTYILLGMLACFTVVLFYLLRRILLKRLVVPIQELATDINPLKPEIRHAPGWAHRLPQEVVQIAGILETRRKDINRHIDELQRANRLASVATERLCREQRLATIGQMAAGLAHGLNTPLGNIVGYAQQGQRDKDANAAGRRFRIIEEQAGICSDIVKSLLASARKPDTVIQPVDMVQLIRTIITLLKPVVTDRGVNEIDIVSRGPCLVAGDVSALEQVFFNLFSNLAQAGATAVQFRFDCEKGLGIVDIEDNGPGMDAEYQAKIFEPFFTTKEAGQGTGLGLYLCRTLMESMKGKIELLESKSGKTVFRLSVPLA